MAKKKENKKGKVAKVTKKKEPNYNRNEIIITIIVLLIAVVIGILGGKALYEAMYGKI